MLAVLVRDEPALRALIVNNDAVAVPPEDFAVLLTGEEPPALAKPMMKTMIPRWKVERLAAGDRVDLGRGRIFVVKPEEVSDTRAVVKKEDDPIPTRCWKIDGVWKVDPRPIIAGRKAAEAARKRAEAQKQADEGGEANDVPSAKP
jgi:hypothetical protein